MCRCNSVHAQLVPAWFSPGMRISSLLAWFSGFPCIGLGDVWCAFLFTEIDPERCVPSCSLLRCLLTFLKYENIDHGRSRYFSTNHRSCGAFLCRVSLYTHCVTLFHSMNGLSYLNIFSKLLFFPVWSHFRQNVCPVLPCFLISAEKAKCTQSWIWHLRLNQSSLCTHTSDHKPVLPARQIINPCCVPTRQIIHPC